MHVIIAGAGPCGLSLSLALARADIDVTLIDRENTIDSRPRAPHMTAPGIQMFKRAGVFDDVRRAGFLPKDWTFRKFDGTPIVTIEDIAVSKSPEATIVLPINKLDEILLSHAEKNSKICLKWGHRVVDVGQDENSAWVIVKKQDGTQTRISGDFLIGCDGGTSQVRKSLFGDKNFPGMTWDVQFVATDVYYPFDKFGYDDVNAMVHPHDSHLVARLTKDGLWRVAYQEDKNMTYQEVLDHQAAHYERILPGHPKPADYTLTNISPYKLHQRCAEKFRVGRICLAGDAAHLCNPWGGLGLTGGFADVTGLADCLEGIATGKADESILDKYDEVRRSIFHTVVDPISTANFLRVSALVTDAAIEKDPFMKMCAAAKHDPKVKEKMEKSVYAICHDFTQYYNCKA
ncbi:hypothetical protein MMC32_002543 [Xylographa parallela]|nr:hypothetical protein [Xylographa parallela]